MIAKQYKDRSRISLSNKKRKNYKRDTKNNIDLDQIDKKYSL